MLNRLNNLIMQAKITKESYALVEKLAYKFAYSTESLEYEEYLSVGLEGLVKAVNNYKEDSDAEFSTFATTCIRNAMCTKQKMLNRFDLQQDENVILDGNGEKEYEDGNDDELVTDSIVNLFTEEMGDSNVTDVLKMVVRKANKDNERNAEMALLHFGLVDDVEEPMDYKELSAKFQVSAERVRQVCVNTINAIKADENAKELLYAFVG